MPFVMSKAAALAVAATTAVTPPPSNVPPGQSSLIPIVMYEPHCRYVPQTRHTLFTTETVLVQQCTNIPRYVYMKQ